MDGRTLSGVAVRRLAAAGVVADARATLYRHDEIARRLLRAGRGAGCDVAAAPHLKPGVPPRPHGRAARLDFGAVLRRENTSPARPGGLDPRDSADRAADSPANTRHARGSGYARNSRYNTGPPRLRWSH